jgi:coenzyme Q-binding protein COQ10
VSVHRESRVVPCSCEQFFDLVADVESYPEFLPLWRVAHIYQREGDVYFTDQQVGVGLWMSLRFRSRTQLNRPTNIEVTSDEGIFEDFRISWHLESAAATRCQVDFELSCDTRSSMMGRVMDVMLLETAHLMVEAFEARARKVYGAEPSH